MDPEIRKEQPSGKQRGRFRNILSQPDDQGDDQDELLELQKDNLEDGNVGISLHAMGFIPEREEGNNVVTFVYSRGKDEITQLDANEVLETALRIVQGSEYSVTDSKVRDVGQSGMLPPSWDVVVNIAV